MNGQLYAPATLPLQKQLPVRCKNKNSLFLLGINHFVIWAARTHFTRGSQRVRLQGLQLEVIHWNFNTNDTSLCNSKWQIHHNTIEWG